MPLVLNGTTGVQDNSGAFVRGTAQTPSGSSVDFTGIPSWVKRITMVMTDVSFAAAGVARIRLGTSGGLVSTGYGGIIFAINTSPTITATGLNVTPEGVGGIVSTGAATTINAQFIIVNVTGNTWQCNGGAARTGDTSGNFGNGFIALAGTLDRVSLVATTSTFDGGTINILYE